ncbi:MAG: sugar porter family MFS transporter [Chloroflexota bacterium]|nr:MAG: MFS transporter [Chloroflexota bacterium]
MTTEQDKSQEQSQGGDGDVLSELDLHIPTSFYWQLTLLATLGGFLFGYDTSNIGSALNFVPYHLNSFTLGYLVAGTSLGAAVGALIAGPVTDRFGRKWLLVADAGIYAVGAILSAVAWNLDVLLAARTLIGLAIGADSAIATAYIAEYAPKAKRGELSILQQWMITVGILVSYIVALAILKIAPHGATTVDWRLILGLGALPALVGLVLRAQMPESPRWLLRQGRYDDMKRALSMFGFDVSTDQIKRTADALAAEDKQRQTAKKSQWTPGVKRALMVVSAFFVFQQITGINVPFYYGPRILSKYFGSGGTVVNSTIAGIEVTIILASVNVAATYFGFRYIDRIGRRVLSMGGYVGMAVFMLVSAFSLTYLTGVTRLIVLMVGLDLFIAAFAIGVGGTGWLIQGEVFPTAVRGRAASIGATADWLANFALIEVFPVWNKGVGLAWVMVSFAGFAVLAIIFVAKFLPETKGLSVEDIAEVFQREAA